MSIIEAIAAAPRDPSDTEPITTVRVLYSDLHGVARGKDVPVREFDEATEDGLAFCAAVMSTDLRHTPVLGGEQGFPDLCAIPDVSTLVSLPWEPGVASVLADVGPIGDGPPPADPRGAVRRAVAGYRELDLEPVMAPELEFFLCRADPQAPGGFRRYVDRLSMVYTVGPQVDPLGVVRGITESLSRLGLGAFAVNHEFMNSQFEINLRHADALTAADRAFRLKSAVKDVAALNGLVATFMGKPFNDQGGSGTHFHVSLQRDGINAFDDPAGDRGCSPLLAHFTAGVLAHAPALVALLNPTINAFRRLVPDSLAPTHAIWGWDNRTAFVRIPKERGRAARAEIRVGDGSCNPYLATAGILQAGLDGIRRELVPPPATGGDGYRADAGDELPRTLEQALDALQADEVLAGALGTEIVEPFVAVKRYEIERHRMHVSEWELEEYLQHL
jgi:glutamine synthetase